MSEPIVLVSFVARYRLHNVPQASPGAHPGAVAANSTGDKTGRPRSRAQSAALRAQMRTRDDVESVMDWASHTQSPYSTELHYQRLGNRNYSPTIS